MSRFSSRRKFAAARPAALNAVAAAGTMLVSGMLACSSQAHAAGLAPHRAVYEMRLDGANSGAGIAGLVGRMVFEFRGSSCDGYTQSMRLVTRVTGRDGQGSVSDVRTSSWEAGDGDVFKFSSTTLRNARLSTASSGSAERSTDDRTTITVDKPAQTRSAIDGEVMFPVTHTREILERARRGERFLAADVFDGSEEGKKYFRTTTVIGRRRAADDQQAVPADRFGLAGLASWPVSIGYYEETVSADAEGRSGPEPDSERPQAEGETLPTYEMAYSFFENGVARGLKIDYGTFRVRGTLSDITYYDQSACD